MVAFERHFDYISALEGWLKTMYERVSADVEVMHPPMELHRLYQFQLLQEIQVSRRFPYRMGRPPHPRQSSGRLPASTVRSLRA